MFPVSDHRVNRTSLEEPDSGDDDYLSVTSIPSGEARQGGSDAEDYLECLPISTSSRPEQPPPTSPRPTTTLVRDYSFQSFIKLVYAPVAALIYNDCPVLVEWKRWCGLCEH